MNLVPLIELSRGGTPECLHLGAVAVVNVRGQLLAQAVDRNEHAGQPTGACELLANMLQRRALQVRRVAGQNQ